ncbi:MAG: glycosyltransferase family 2 protein [Thermoplasmatota archaeon]
MATPRVSVIIPVHNDRERLARCLDALGAQRGAPDFEVLVIDNGSTDDPASILAGQGPRMRLLSEATPGSYVARNAGLLQAQGDLLAFTDSDCIPAPDWLARLTQALDRDPGLDLVAGRIDLFPADPAHLTVAETYEAVHGFEQEMYVRERHYGATANLMARRRVFDSVGPFDARLKSGGDKEWCQRAHAAGKRIGYEDTAVVAHPMRHRLSELGKKVRRTWGGELDRGAYRVLIGLRAHLFWPYIFKSTVTRPIRCIPKRVRQARANHVSAWRFVAACWYRDWVKWTETVRVRWGGASRR